MMIKPISASALKSLARSPEHCYANHVDPNRERRTTDAMTFGSLIHCMILESHLVDERYAVMPEGMTRRGGVWTDFKAANEGKEIVKYDVFEKAKTIVDLVMKDEMAGSLLTGRKKSIKREHKLEWTDYKAVNGEFMLLPFTGYIDLVNTTTRVIVDIKTTSNADDLSKLAKDGRWDLQACQYLTGAEKSFLGEDYRMVFLVVETTSPFRIRGVELSPDAIRAGRTDRKRLVEEYARRQLEDDWSGNTGVSRVDMPVWFSRTLEDLNEQ